MNNENPSDDPNGAGAPEPSTPPAFEADSPDRQQLSPEPTQDLSNELGPLASGATPQDARFAPPGRHNSDLASPAASDQSQAPQPSAQSWSFGEPDPSPAPPQQPPAQQQPPQIASGPGFQAGQAGADATPPMTPPPGAHAAPPPGDPWNKAQFSTADEVSHTTPLPAFAQQAGVVAGAGAAPGNVFGQSTLAPAGATHRRGKPGWLWPGVAALAMVVGLIGGAVGGIAVQSWSGNGAASSTTSVTGGEGTTSVPPIQDGNESVSLVAENVLPSTVQIVADANGQANAATGSGWVYDSNGHIITNNHVIEGAGANGNISVIDHDGNRFKAELVGTSPIYDIAVLNVPDAKALKPAALGDSESIKVGAEVVALGSPLGLSDTVTSGIISAKNRPVTTNTTGETSAFINALQTDAAINPGNSGGPLVDMQGRVVGVNSAIATTGTTGGEAGNIGVGFAIPIEQVTTTAKQILQSGKAEYPVIGATVQTGGTDATALGATIESVQGNSPAKDAGLQKNDVITALDGAKVTDGEQLIVMIRSHLPGDKIELTYTRNGKQEKTTLTLDGKEG